MRTKRSGPTRRFEGVWRRKGLSVVAGVDEAGRGCLAGPVVAGALILPARIPRGIDDSKKLSPQKREALFEALRDSGTHLAWGVAAPHEIDTLNIRQASFLAMRRAVDQLPCRPEALLVDGFEIPDYPTPQRALVRGDARSLSIAAASIVAKVVRDRMMVAYGERDPRYGFGKHKGYPTAQHVLALERFGPCELHRWSFEPVRWAAAKHVAIKPARAVQLPIIESA
ncbi:ribonuclease HII [Candidatus Eisenbacteria bacterium]|uniref:Ribonuclease HII n=1 Tax=Eiseniibacteriota bacterium TaxID=2212470 RepID=A0ABV6YJF6_UNCEI